MSVATPIELTPAQPPGATRPPAPPGGPPGAQSFHSALEGELARTAPAEGQELRSPEGASQQPAHEPRQSEDAQAGAAQEALASLVAPGATPIAADAGEAPTTGGRPSLPSTPTVLPQLATSHPLAPAATADPSLASPAPGATPPLATVGTNPKAPLPPDGQEPDEAAGTGISISHAQENQARPGVPVTASPVRSPEVVTSGPGSEAGEAQAPGIAVPKGPPKQGPAPVDLGIRVQGGAVKKSLEDITAGLSPDAEAASGSASHGAATVSTAQPERPAPSLLSASQGHESRPAPAGAANVDLASSAPGPESGSTSPLAPTAAVAPSVATATPTGGAQPPVVAAGVGMQEMIESVRATIGLAVRQGISQARIALQPAELGEIRIHLSQGADGLIARVTAGSEAAAQALAQGRAELHHSLSTIGPSLLRLEIGAFNQPSQDRERSAENASGSASARGATGEGASIEEDEPTTPISAAAASEPRGELIDVHA